MGSEMCIRDRDIFFYKGEEGVDVDIVDIQESIKIGDELRVMKSPLTNTVGLTTTQQNERLVKEILNANTLETDIYSGRGVDETNKKPIRWTKQKTDIRVGNEVISKARPSIEPQIYPTCLLYTSPSPRDLSTSRMPSSA